MRRLIQQMSLINFLLLLGILMGACSPPAALIVEDSPSESDPALVPIPISDRPALAARPESTLTVWVEEDIFYMDGRTLDVYAPDADDVWPIVVLLHGGTTNNKSLSELSYSLASNGVIAVVPTWSAHPPQASYITKGWDEVACSLRFAQKYADERGIPHTRMIIIGHSVGGASGFVSLVAGQELPSECFSNASLPEVDAFISLDGVYNTLDQVPAARLEEGDPEEWGRINPYQYLDEFPAREDLEIVFITSLMEEYEKEGADFMEALENAGYTAAHIRMPEFDHFGVASPYPEVMEIILGVVYPN